MEDTTHFNVEGAIDPTLPPSMQIQAWMDPKGECHIDMKKNDLTATEQAKLTLFTTQFLASEAFNRLKNIKPSNRADHNLN